MSLARQRPFLRWLESNRLMVVNTFFIDTNLPNGTYYYAVTAVNASGASILSNFQSVIVIVILSSNKIHRIKPHRRFRNSLVLVRTRCYRTSSGVIIHVKDIMEIRLQIADESAIQSITYSVNKSVNEYYEGVNLFDFF